MLPPSEAGRNARAGIPGRAPLAAEFYDLFRSLLRHQLEQWMTNCREKAALLYAIEPQGTTSR